MKKALGMQCRKGKQINLDGGSGVSNHQSIFRFDFGADHLGKVKYRNESFWLSMLVCDHWIPILPIGATGIPGRMVPEPNRVCLTQKLHQESLRVGMNRLLQLGMELAQSRLVNIHTCFMCFASQVLRCVSSDREIQPYSDSKKQIGVLQGKVRAARRDRTRSANIQGITARNQIGCAPSRHRRDSKPRPDLFKFLLCVRQAYTVTREKQGAFSAVQLFKQAPDFVLQRPIGGRLLQLRGIKAAQSRWLSNRRSLDIERDIDPHRTGAAVEGKIDSHFQMVANVVGIENRDRVLRNRLHDRDYVYFLHAK